MTTKSYFSGNLRYLRNRKNQSQQELSSVLGITRATVGHYETGKVKNIPSDELISISEHYKIPVDILLKTDISSLPESMLKEIENNRNVYTGKDVRIVVTTVDSNNNENIEFVPVKAKAGYLAGYADPEFIGKLPVFNLPHLPKNRKYRMFPTDGDSMLPIPEGVFVVGEYLEDWYSLKDEDLCIVVTQNEGIVFKQVFNQLEEKKKLVLRSLNPIYSDYIVPVEEILEIWKFRNYISDDTPDGDVSLLHVLEDLKDVKAGVSKILNKIGK